MVSFLLDTCVLAELIRPRPEPKVIRWLDSQREDDLFLSVLTVGEIQKGARKAADPVRRARIQKWLDGELRPRFSSRLLPVCESAALVWGRLMAEAELRGEPLPAVDLLIAATGRAHSLTVVTRNQRDLERCSVAVLNPWL